MRKGRFIGGVVLVVIGVILILLSFNPTVQTIPQFPSGITYQPKIIGGGTLNVNWTGGTASTVVEVWQCNDASCSPPPTGGLLAKGTGATGSISISVSSSATYGISVTAGGTAVGASLGLLAITYLVLIGIVLAALGVFLAINGLRTSKKVMTAPTPYAAAPPPEPTAQYAPPSSYMQPQDPSALPTGGPPPDQTVAPPDPSGAGRAPVKCGNCGVYNEPWLTNCRWCKRPLASTSSR